MRTWIKVSDLPSLEELLRHSRSGCGRFSYSCKFCEVKGIYVEAYYSVIYDSEALEPPHNIQKVPLCLRCAKPAIDAIGVNNLE